MKNDSGPSLTFSTLLIWSKPLNLWSSHFPNSSVHMEQDDTGSLPTLRFYFLVLFSLSSFSPDSALLSAFDTE